LRAVWTAAAILAALLLQTALGIVMPTSGRVLDPFLLVVVYCGLAGGETHGMLAGVAAGWVQDIHFGGSVAGLSALSKLVVGYAVGLAGNRFMIVGTGPRLLVLIAATVADAVLFDRLALVFEVGAAALSVADLLTRAAVNALVGAAVFGVVDFRLRRWEARP
jgi:rod shape-determining protein MreD